jgi:hypothetical protein
MTLERHGAMTVGAPAAPASRSHGERGDQEIPRQRHATKDGCAATRGLGSRNSHFHRPDGEALTGAASAIAVGKRWRCTSWSRSGSPQPTGECESDGPLLSPELGGQPEPGGQEMTPALRTAGASRRVPARVPDRAEGETAPARVLASALLMIGSKRSFAADSSRRPQPKEP